MVTHTFSLSTQEVEQVALYELRPFCLGYPPKQTPPSLCKYLNTGITGVYIIYLICFLKFVHSLVDKAIKEEEKGIKGGRENK